MIRTFRRKPKDFKAIQFIDDSSVIAEISDLLPDKTIKIRYDKSPVIMEIDRHIFEQGDWVVLGMDGTVSCCKDDFFKEIFVLDNENFEEVF